MPVRDGNTIRHIAAMPRTEIAELQIGLVKLAIVPVLALVRIGPRLNLPVERVPVVVEPRIGPRLNRPVEAVPVAVQRQIGHRLDRRGAVERTQ